MNLSDAIRKRTELAEKLKVTDEWYYEQLKNGSFPCDEVKKYVIDAMEDIGQQYEELFVKVEKFIEGMEIKE